MKLDNEKRYTFPNHSGEKTHHVQTLELSNLQLGFMNAPRDIPPGKYVLEYTQDGKVHALTPITLESEAERELFRNEKAKFNQIVINTLRG